MPAGRTARVQRKPPNEAAHAHAHGAACRLFLLAQFALVQCFGFASPALAQAPAAKSGSAKKRQPALPPGPEVRYGTDRLPGPVQDMREAILGAVRSGRIDELRHAWELNELKPDLGVAPADWRSNCALEAYLG